MKRKALILFFIVVSSVFCFGADEPDGGVFSAAARIEQPAYRLLELKTEQTDADALLLYLKAFAADPNHPEQQPNHDFIAAQLQQPAKSMDMPAVEAELNKCRDKLALLQKASLCKRIQWPVIKQKYQWNIDEEMMLWAVMPDENNGYEPPVYKSTEYLDFMQTVQQYGKLVALKVRFHIAKGQYEMAAEWLKAGLCMGRQMVVNSNTQMGMVATAHTATMLQQVELWAQTPGSPSLYRSLQDVPRPFLQSRSLVSLIEPESDDNRRSRKMPGNMEPMFGMEEPQQEKDAKDTAILPDYSGEQIALAMSRIDRFVAILECLEGLRYYAALYDGLPPASLSDISEIRLPTDPITRQAFAYTRGEAGLTLKAPDWDDKNEPAVFSYVLHFER